MRIGEVEARFLSGGAARKSLGEGAVPIAGRELESTD